MKFRLVIQKWKLVSSLKQTRIFHIKIFPILRLEIQRWHLIDIIFMHDNNIDQIELSHNNIVGFKIKSL